MSDQPIKKTGFLRSKTFLLSLMCLAIFISGIAIGSVGSVWYIKRPSPPPALPHRRNNPDRFIKRMRETLNINDEQATKIRAVFDKHHQQVDKLFRSISPQLKEAFDQASAEVNEVLTPEQAKKWKEETERIRKRFPHGKKRHWSDKKQAAKEASSPEGKKQPDNPPPPEEKKE